MATETPRQVIGLSMPKSHSCVWYWQNRQQKYLNWQRLSVPHPLDPDESDLDPLTVIGVEALAVSVGACITSVVSITLVSIVATSACPLFWRITAIDRLDPRACAKGFRLLKFIKL
jgi:hypothetical protein